MITKTNHKNKSAQVGINLMQVWKMHQHLTFGEIRDVVDAAVQTIDDKVWEITRRNIAAKRN